MISDNHIEVCEGVISYKSEDSIGIVCNDTVIEPLYTTLYKVGNSLSLINRINGQLVYLRNNKIVNKFTQYNIIDSVISASNFKENCIQVIGGSKAVELALYYSIALELTLNLDYHIKTKFKNFYIENIYGKKYPYNLELGYRNNNGNLEIHIKDTNKNKYTLVSLYDIKHNTWIISPLEIVTIHESTSWYSRYVNELLMYAYYITDNFQRTESIPVNGVIYRKSRSRFNQSYKIFTVCNNNYDSIILIDDTNKTINILLKIRHGIDYTINNFGMILIKLSDRLIRTSNIIDINTYKNICSIHNKKYNNKGNCYIIIDLVTNTMFNGIIILNKLIENTTIIVDVFNTDGQSYRAYFNTSKFNIEAL